MLMIYRFYILDSSGALKGAATRMDCADDNAAIKQAKLIVGGCFVELWQGERRIGRFETKTQSKPPNLKR
jgi:hypothetical protein